MDEVQTCAYFAVAFADANVSFWKPRSSYVYCRRHEVWACDIR